MSRLTAFLGFSLLATSALAGELVANPTYLGVPSNNAEQETYATRVDAAMFTRTLAFIGPSRNVGPVTGEPEEDTVAYSPLFVDPEECNPHSTHTTNLEFNSDGLRRPDPR
jgi:hypothetical protein